MLIGDTVNLASRLEGLTKYYGIQIAIGSALQAHIGDFATLLLDHVRVVGRDTPEAVHVLIGDEAVAASPEFTALRLHHDMMIAAYLTMDWDAGEAALAALEPIAPAYKLTEYYTLMARRIAQFRVRPPGVEWDGIFVAAEK